MHVHKIIHLEFHLSNLILSCLRCLSLSIIVYACGPKTALVKRTFLNIAILGLGVGWGGGGC